MSGLDELQLTLPAGWREIAGEPTVREFRPRADEDGGVLQVSRRTDDEAAWFATVADLGALAGELGRRFGWGDDFVTKQATCAMGRLGLATFRGGEFPMMVVFLTVSPTSALMWTWLGPAPPGDEMRDALAIITGARA